MPLISVIIPTRNEAAYIRQCLDDLLHQDLPRDSFEIIVADGMSDDGTRQVIARIAASDSCVRLIDNPHHFVSFGLNIAIREARGEYIARVDAHTRIAPDYLSRCLEVAQKTAAANVGGPWNGVPGPSLSSRCIAAAFHHPFAIGGGRSHAVDYEGLVDTVYLGFWRKEIFSEIGFFDEELVRNQDDEYNLRLIRSGKKIWQSPFIRSQYTVRGSFCALWRQYYQYGFWKIRVMQKHRLPASPRHIVPALFVTGLLMGPFIGLLHAALMTAYCATLLLYLAAVVGASLQIALRSGLKMFPMLPLAFVTFHLAYGFGSLEGIIHFLLLKRRPSQTRGNVKKITR